VNNKLSVYPKSETLVNAALLFFFGGSCALALPLVSDPEFLEARIPPLISSVLDAGVNGAGESPVRLFFGTVGVTTGEGCGGSDNGGMEGVDAGVAAGVLEYIRGTEL
jgi:hypothetical protein